MGGGNMLAFFDFPEHGNAPVVRGIGAMHHVALKATLDQYKALFERLREQGIAYSLEGTEEAGSVYIRDPDNALIEVTCR
jgi:catechol 2,3-dioxygenase-like lactoylglutathione lyase family enzyme